MSEEYVVYRSKIRNHLYFVPQERNAELQARIAVAAKTGFTCRSLLSYTSAYIVDLTSNTIIKNNCADQDWPKQIFEAVFSGVDNVINI